MSQPKATTSKSHRLHHLAFLINNLGQHLDHTFELWSIKSPSLQTRLTRSLIFVSCLLIITLWPLENILNNGIIIVLAWIVLGLTKKPVNHWLLMLNIQFNIAWLFYLVNACLSLLK